MLDLLLTMPWRGGRKRRGGTRAIAAAGLVFLTSCMPTKFATKTPFRPPSPRADQATLIFVQRGSFLSRVVTMDRTRFLGQTKRASWFETAVPPGKHTFETFVYEDGSMGGCFVIEGEVLPGKTYYVLERWSTGSRVEGTSAGEKGAQLLLDVSNEGDDGQNHAWGWDVRVIRKKEQVSMDPWEYLRSRDRMEPKLTEGQKVIPGLFEKSQAAWEDLMRRIQEDPAVTPAAKEEWAKKKTLCTVVEDKIGPEDDLR
jgi:hypothetical protein